jgi:uncharacterized membrane protein
MKHRKYKGFNITLNLSGWYVVNYSTYGFGGEYRILKADTITGIKKLINNKINPLKY